jgi:hypothetical protein
VTTLICKLRWVAGAKCEAQRLSVTARKDRISARRLNFEIRAPSRQLRIARCGVDDLIGSQPPPIERRVDHRVSVRTVAAGRAWAPGRRVPRFHWPSPGAGQSSDQEPRARPPDQPPRFRLRRARAEHCAASAIQHGVFFDRKRVGLLEPPQSLTQPERDAAAPSWPLAEPKHSAPGTKTPISRG